MDIGVGKFGSYAMLVVIYSVTEQSCSVNMPCKMLCPLEP